MDIHANFLLSRIKRKPHKIAQGEFILNGKCLFYHEVHEDLEGFSS